MTTLLEQSFKQTQMAEYGLDPSLVLYLPLWMLDGRSIMSRDAYGHLCTVTGAIWGIQGRSFDGADDRILIPDAAKVLGAHTIFFWINPTSWTATDSPSVIGGRGLGTQASQGGIAFTRSLTNLLYEIYDADSSNSIQVPTSAVPLSQWTLITLRWDGIGIGQGSGMDIHLNGTLQPFVGSSIGITAPINWGIYPLYLGFAQRNYYKGLIGEALIYNRALSALEIQRKYLATRFRCQ